MDFRWLQVQTSSYYIFNQKTDLSEMIMYKMLTFKDISRHEPMKNQVYQHSKERQKKLNNTITHLPHICIFRIG